MEYSSLEPITDKRDFSLFEKDFIENPQKIAIFGKSRSGKTALMFRLAENKIATNEAVGHSLRYPLELEGFDRITKLDSAVDDSVVVCGEMGLTYPSVSERTNARKLAQSLYLSAQRGITFIGNAQQSTSTTIKFIRNLDIIVIKEPSLIQIETERRTLKKLFGEARRCFEVLSPNDRIKYAYIYSNYYSGMVKSDLPSFWSDDISYAFKNYKPK